MLSRHVVETLWEEPFLLFHAAPIILPYTAQKVPYESCVTSNIYYRTLLLSGAGVVHSCQVRPSAMLVISIAGARDDDTIKNKETLRNIDTRQCSKIPCKSYCSIHFKLFHIFFYHRGNLQFYTYVINYICWNPIFAVNIARVGTHLSN